MKRILDIIIIIVLISIIVYLSSDKIISNFTSLPLDPYATIVKNAPHTPPLPPIMAPEIEISKIPNNLIDETSNIVCSKSCCNMLKYEGVNTQSLDNDNNKDKNLKPLYKTNLNCTSSRDTGCVCATDNIKNFLTPKNLI